MGVEVPGVYVTTLGISPRWDVDYLFPFFPFFLVSFASPFLFVPCFFFFSGLLGS